MQEYSIHVSADLVQIPLALFANNTDLELIIDQEFALVRPKVRQSIFHISENHDEMLAQVEAFEAAHTGLVETHLGLFVAFHQGKLVDQDDDELRLVRRIDQKFPEQVVLVRQVLKDLPPPLRLPVRFTLS